jgi:D-alanyl-D-alanine carboxypeptidase/D-alanyl-D-alanine-endopeptidase (penicillin-binding protein 4)
MRFAALLLGFVLGSSASLASAGQAAEPVCTSDLATLATRIEAITHRTEFRRARWGILIQTVEANPRTLYASDADKFFVPASNLKLLTTAAALTRLGAGFRFHTFVYQVPTSDQSIVLKIVGEGDPSFSDAQLQSLVQQIQARGIHHIDQLIVADDQQDAINPNWEWEDIQAGYGAPSNRLILNQNAIGLSLSPQELGQPLGVKWDDSAEIGRWQIVNHSVTVATTQPEFVSVGRNLSRPILVVAGQLRVGAAAEPVSVAIPNPAQYFLERLQQLLAAQQIQVGRTTVEIASVDSAQITLAQMVATIASPPLSELLRETNQQSNNLYAEAMLRALGDQAKPEIHSSRLTAGIAAVSRALTALGVDPSGYRLADGSGLSRHNLVSPETLIATLQAMAVSSDAAAYKASLAVAGVSGTLRSRFLNTPAAGRFYGKTGGLSQVVALSGYLELPNWSEQSKSKPSNLSKLAVSILVNHSATGSNDAEAAIDAIILLLTTSRLC